MCQIMIVKKGNVDKIDKKQLDRFQKANPHGIGVAIVTKTGTIVEKRIDSVGGLIAYLNIAKLYDGDIIVHFRYKTGASANKTVNAHPFSFEDENRDKEHFITNSPLLFHNGTLSSYEGNQEVDTYNFLKFGLKENAQRKEMLKMYAKSNRFVFIENGTIELYGDWKIDGEFTYANDRGVKEYTAPSYTSYSGKGWTRYAEAEEEEFLFNTKNKKDNIKNTKQTDAIETALEKLNTKAIDKTQMPTYYDVKYGMSLESMFECLLMAGIEDIDMIKFAELLFQEDEISADSLETIINMIKGDEGDKI